MKDKLFSPAIIACCVAAICIYPHFTKADDEPVSAKGENSGIRELLMEDALKEAENRLLNESGGQAENIETVSSAQPESISAEKKPSPEQKIKKAEKNSLAIMNSFASVDGDKGRFRQQLWMKDGYTGGLESFSLDEDLEDKKRLHMEGRVLSDSDYNLLLNLAKENYGYMRLSFDQFRKYYDDSGGWFVFPNAAQPNFYELGQNLHTDRTNFSLDFALTKPEQPKYLLGYEHKSRRGKINLGLANVTSGTTQKYIYPQIKEIDWAVDALKAGMEGKLKGFNFVFNQQIEQYTENSGGNSVDSVTNNVFPTNTVVVQNEPSHRSSTTSLTAEGKVNKKLYVKAGDMFSKLAGKAKFDRNWFGSTGALTGTYFDGEQNTDQNNNAFSAGLRYKAMEDLMLVARFRQQNIRTSSSSNYIRDTSAPIGTIDSIRIYDSDVDEFTLGESLGFEYSGITRTKAYFEIEGEQSQVKYAQTYLPLIGSTPFWRDSHVDLNKNTYTLGINTRPTKPLFVSSRFRRIIRDNDHINYTDTTAGYPAYIGDNDSLTDEFTLRTNLKPNRFISFVIKFQDSQTKYNVSKVNPDEIASSHIRTSSVSANFNPTARLSLETLFSMQDSMLETAAYSRSPAIDFYNGNSNSFITTISYSLNEKTSLNSQYQGWSADGTDALFQGISLGLERRLREYIDLKLGYAYYTYDEESNAGINDYKANVVYTSLKGKF